MARKSLSLLLTLAVLCSLLAPAAVAQEPLQQTNEETTVLTPEVDTIVSLGDPDIDPDMTVIPEPEEEEDLTEPAGPVLLNESPAEVGMVTISIETQTINEKNLLEPTKVALLEDDTVYTLLDRVAAEKGLEVKSSSSMVSSIGGFTTGAYSDYSGWMVSLNNDVNMELPELPQNGDIVRWHYSVDWFGYDIILLDKIAAAKTISTTAAAKLAENNDDPFNETDKKEEPSSSYMKLTNAKSALDTKLQAITDKVMADGMVSYITENTIYGNGNADDDSELTTVTRLSAAVEQAMKGYIAVTDATISVVGSPAEYYVGQTYQLQANFTPVDATDKTPIWEVLLGNGTVDTSGKLTINGTGRIMVRVCHADTGSNTSLDTLTIDPQPKSALTELQVTDAMTKLPPVLLEQMKNSITSDWHYIHLTLDGKITDTSTLSAPVQAYIAQALKAIPTATKATDLERYAIALQAMGVDITALPGKDGSTLNLFHEISRLSKTDNANGAAYALISLDSANYSDESLPVKRAEIIDYLLNTQIAGGGWALSTTATIADSDITNMVILGLAPYYTDSTHPKHTQVKTAVDNALAILASRMADNGVMPNVSAWGSSQNSNSTAVTILTLAALGRNPATDAAFTKNGNTLLDGLMSFYIAEGANAGQFQYTISSNPWPNMKSNEQAYAALQAHKRVAVATEKKAIKFYDFTGLSIPSRTINTTVSLRIEGMETNHYFDNITVDNNGVLTVDKVVEAAVPAEKRTIENGSYGPYITALYGDTANYFGVNYDGWVYTVNGVSPSVGVGGYALLPGDTVVIYYGNGDTVVPHAPKVTYNAGGATLTFTADVTTYDAEWNPTVTEQPVKDMTVTWYYGENNGQKATYTTNAQGVVTLDPTQCEGGDHKIEIAKQLTVAGKDKTLPQVLRYPANTVVKLEQQETVSSDKQVTVSGSNDPYTIYTVTGGSQLSLKTTVKNYGSNDSIYSGGSIPKFDANIGTTKGQIQFQFPKQTVYSKTGATWDGVFYAPYLDTKTRSANVEYTLQFGSANNVLEDLSGVRILLPNVSGKKVGYVDENGDIKPISVMNSDSGSGFAPGAKYGYFVLGNDIAVWAKEDAPIVVYTESSGGNPTPSDKITVSFTLNGDTKHGDAAHTGSYPTWISKKSYTLENGSTVKELLEAALSENGIIHITDGSYVSSINGLAEFDNGPRSGWVYTVNGIKVGESYADYTLKSGDTVIWKYIDTYDDTDTGMGQPESSAKPNETKPLEFPDVPASHPAKEAIDLVSAKGIMNGADGGFAPEKTASRAEVVTVLYRYAGQPTISAVPTFGDVKAGDWYYNSVAWANSTGITKGTSEGFNPTGEMTGEQLAVMLYSFAKDKVKPGTTGTVPANAANWAKEALQWAANTGLLNITDAKATVSRADLAVVIAALDKAFSK